MSTLEDMKDKAESALNSLRRDEMKSRHAFEMIKQSLEDAITNLNLVCSMVKSRLAMNLHQMAAVCGIKKPEKKWTKTDSDKVWVVWLKPMKKWRCAWELISTNATR